DRQASYLVDIITPEATRRRARQHLSERFDRAMRLVQRTAEHQKIAIQNDISEEFRTPPMFSAELTAVLSNLLTNAVKAAGIGGTIRASAKRTAKSEVLLRVENTGQRVELDTSEQWFRPFASTTGKVDFSLGHGMGLGLTITRFILEEYGAEIAFVR